MSKKKEPFTANKILVYLTILGILGAYYISLPEVVLVLPPSSTQYVCPSFLDKLGQREIALRNGGKVSAVFNVTFKSAEILFIDDMGNMRGQLSYAYRIEPDKDTAFKFKPDFNITLKNETITINIECSSYVGFFCKTPKQAICCFYEKKSYSSQLSLIEEKRGC